MKRVVAWMAGWVVLTLLSMIPIGAALAESPQANHLKAVQVSVDEAVLTENEWRATLTIHTQQPVFMVLENVWAGEQAFYITEASLEDGWSMHPITGKAWKNEQYTISMECPENLPSDTPVTLELAFLAPQNLLCPIDVHDAPAAMWEAIDACVERGDTPIENDEPWHVLIGSKFFAQWGEDVKYKECAQYPIGDTGAFVTCANMRVLDTVKLTVALNE